MSWVRTVTKDRVDVQGLCITGPAPYHLQHSGELAPSLNSSSTWESRPFALSKQHSTVELALMCVWVSCPKGVREN